MLKPIKKPAMLKAEPPKKEKTKEKKKNLPPDSYKDEIEPLELYVDESRKFVVSVKRGGEFGLPMCDVRQFSTTDVYTGYTKKGVNFPIELIPELIEHLQVAYDECDKLKLVDESHL